MVTGESVASVLSAQQQAVLALSAAGLISTEVAETLQVPVAEVRSHLADAIRALGARSKLEAVIIALRSGLIQLRDEQPSDLTTVPA
jgi:LuxR family transcriptional regulator, regulator of acetate metabolism